MESLPLRRLAAEGLDAVAPHDVRGLSRWCWEEGVRTGDARYCVVAKTLELVASSYEDWDAIPIGDIDRAIAEDLASILEEKNPAAASLRAWRMKERVQTALTEWWTS